MPDWGFGLGRGGLENELSTVAHPAAREFITVALRGDRRRPSEEWLDAVARLATRLDLTLVCVVQVEDDDSLAHDLADRMGAELVSWRDDGDHWAQEQRVRTVYASSVIVFSDRLHGLVMAATEGAIPLGWCEATTAKVSNHFDVIGAEWVAPGEVSSVDLIDALDSVRVDELSACTDDRVRDARRRVDAIRAQLRAAESP